MAQKIVAGIDIGGTGTTFGLIDERGNILAQNKISTCDYADFGDFVETLRLRINEMAAALGNSYELSGIGIGAPAVSAQTGRIEGAVDLPWPSPIDLRGAFSSAFGLPVGVNNDANAAAIGEATYGAARGLTDFIIITLGTGVGSGIYADGRLIYGHRGLAGELGHTIIRRGGRQCNCGRRGCLDVYASARGIVQTALEMLAQSDAPSTLRDIDPACLTSRDVAEAAEKGDETARRVFDFTGRLLGEACADFAAFSSPQAIILFGGVVNAGSLLMNPLREEFERSLLWIYKPDVQILTSTLPQSDAALLGASAMGWDAIASAS